MIRILIVDCYPIARRGILLILKEHFGAEAVIDEAASGEECLNKLFFNDYKLILLDIALQNISALDLMGRIKRETPDTEFLITAMHSDVHYVLQALKAGARGILTKEDTPEELISATAKILLGGKYVSSAFSEEMIRKGIFNENGRASHTVLSEREFRVLCDIASGKTMKEIADQLCLSIKTVSTYRSRILSKMNLKNNAAIISYAITNDLVNAP